MPPGNPEVTPAPRDALQALDTIEGLTADSREVRPGWLFAALPGAEFDGRAFIADALERGATALLVPAGTAIDAPGVTVIEDSNPRRCFARMAAAFFDAQPATVAAVTGTNGKTSTVQFTRQIWEKLGHAAASLGTIGLVAPGYFKARALTTADPAKLHRDLSRLARAGVTHLAMEASSHGLDQCRLDGVRIKVAGFTNLTRDHLDYHQTPAAYLAAKARLFTELLPVDGAAVLNADDAAAESLAGAARARGCRVLTYGRAGADIRILDQQSLPHGQVLELECLGRRHRAELPLIGTFQAWNVACALGMALGGGADTAAALDALASLTGVRGRVELAGTHGNGAAVYVDYAHTPDALETLLKALRPHCQGRLVLVFGAGGDRDRGKRPLMGEVAARLADIAIVTDDNPRGEDKDAIRRDVLEGCPDAQDISPREDAIKAGIALLQPGDLLVIAGKGHEQGQLEQGILRPFDDVTVARAALAETSG